MIKCSSQNLRNLPIPRKVTLLGKLFILFNPKNVVPLILSTLFITMFLVSFISDLGYFDMRIGGNTIDTSGYVTKVEIDYNDETGPPYQPNGAEIYFNYTTAGGFLMRDSCYIFSSGLDGAPKKGAEISVKYSTKYPEYSLPDIPSCEVEGIQTLEILSFFIAMLLSLLYLIKYLKSYPIKIKMIRTGTIIEPTKLEMREISYNDAKSGSPKTTHRFSVGYQDLSQNKKTIEFDIPTKEKAYKLKREKLTILASLGLPHPDFIFENDMDGLIVKNNALTPDRSTVKFLIWILILTLFFLSPVIGYLIGNL